MGGHGAPKRVRHIAAELPDVLVHVIFLKLDFETKVIAGQVCKKWHRLLKAPIAGARHWDVDLNIDTTVSGQALIPEQAPIVERFKATIGRWLINRAAAIKVVHVSATLSSNQKGVATMHVLESQLPLLAGCLAKHVYRLELTFHRGSPFASPRLSSSAFLTFLCPMLKRLSLCTMRVPVTASQFAAICELSSLEELSIVADDEPEQAGLQEMTSDISKLVNLTTLDLHGTTSPLYPSIPESISCLQKLEVMSIAWYLIEEVPSGLAMLANLSSLVMRACGPLLLPPSLQGLKSLTSVSLDDCSLEAIPEVLTGLSTLTYMRLDDNHFHSSDGWPWWPVTLSRLTKLAELVICRSFIVSLPPHISGLRQLTKLDVHCNKLRSLPEQLSSLQNLRDLQADSNHLPTVPVSVPSSLTALTSISLWNQHPGGSATFQVSSTLLPTLHPGLVELDLRQSGRSDPLSLWHLGHAMAEIADRTSVLTLKF